MPTTIKEQQQEIFSTVVEHLLTQGEQAIDKSGAYLYRTADGRRCAAGCLIPDDVYSPDMEGINIHALLTERAKIQDTKTRAWVDELLPHVDLLWCLQVIHDDFPPSLWASELRQLAEDLKLVMPGEER